MSSSGDSPTCPVRGVPLVDFDVTSMVGAEAANDAHRELRRRAPVAYSEDNGGAWILSGYDVVTEGMRAWEHLSSEREVRGCPGAGGSRGIPSTTVLPFASDARMIPLELDPPAWQAYRRVFAGLLSPGAVDAMKPRIEESVTTMIDSFIESGECDIVAALNSPLPGAVALEWLGFPEHDWSRMSAAVHDMSEATPELPDFQRYIDELDWVFGRIEAEVAARRGAPRDDVLSVFANVEIDGRLVPLDYAVGMANLAYSGGVDTTTSAISAGVVHLHHNRDDRRRLIAAPELMDGAIEEILRVYSPVRNQGRTVVEPIELGGHTLLKDDRVIVSLCSANEDEQAFPDAQLFELDRFPNRHIAFGIGPHRCPGSHLARAELKEALTQLLDRMPDYEIVEPGLAEYPYWYALGGWIRIPISFTPGERRTPSVGVG